MKTPWLEIPENRNRLEKEAQIIATEMDLDKFDYIRHFPNGSRKHLVSGRPDGDISFASLLLRVGEDPAWIARMIRHTTTPMPFER